MSKQKTNEEIQAELAPMFRAGELARRAARHKIILNHAALEDEPLIEKEQEITKEAFASIKRQNEAFEEATRVKRGYWRDLGRALLGKK